MKKRKLSPAAKRAISNRMIAYWAKKRLDKKKAATKSLGQRVASDLPWKLSVLVNDPHDDSVHVKTVFGEDEKSLLPYLLDHMFGGNVIHEYRLEKI